MPRNPTSKTRKTTKKTDSNEGLGSSVCSVIHDATSSKTVTIPLETRNFPAPKGKAGRPVA
jgi:hypothetical protein